MTGRLLDAVESGWHRHVELATPTDPERAALFYPDGTIRFRHTCRAIGPDQLLCAPRLQLGNGHTVIQAEPLTIVASVLCEDCGTHGFITDGRWVPT